MDPAKPLQKPLSYLVQRCVMQYMEANRRFTLAAHCPSLRSIHKSVPLTIDYLKLDETQFTLNEFSHEFHSFMEASSGDQLPLDLVLLNNYGGKPYDLNQFGNKDKEEDMKFGDVKVPGQHEKAGASFRNSKIEYLPYIQFSLQYLPKPTPFLHQKRIRFSPGVKIRNAIRDHLGTILNGTTLVRHLEVAIDKGILRIPRSFKIQNLTTVPNALKPLQPCIQWEHSPLKTIYTSSSYRTHESDMVRAFPCLVLVQSTNSSPNLILKLLRNKVVFAMNCIMYPELIQELVTVWKGKNRKIGTKLSMELKDSTYLVYDLQNLKQLLVDSGWKQRPGEIHPGYPQCISLPMNATSELNIYVESSRTRENALVVVMEVMPAGTAI